LSLYSFDTNVTAEMREKKPSMKTKADFVVRISTLIKVFKHYF